LIPNRVQIVFFDPLLDHMLALEVCFGFQAGKRVLSCYVKSRTFYSCVTLNEKYPSKLLEKKPNISFYVFLLNFL